MMEGLKVIDTENRIVIPDNKSKAEKRAKGCKIGSSPRKRLADISNMQRLTKPSNQDAQPHQNFSLVTSDYIDKLHKENMTLMTVLVDRNKIIELSGNELQKLRVTLQKVQQQNLQLAQANSQMLGELTACKDKLKALQHELGCKNGLLKARKFVVEHKEKTMTCIVSENQVQGYKHEEEEGKFTKGEEADNKLSNARRRGRPSKIKSLDSFTVKSIQANEKIDNKRPCLERQSARFTSEESVPTEEKHCIRRQARFKSEDAESAEESLCSRRQSAGFQSEEPKPTEKRGVCTRRQSALFKSKGPEITEGLCEIDEAKVSTSPQRDEVVHGSGPTSSNLSVKREQKGHGNEKDDTPGNRRLSRRPSRQAAAKVHSYKEIPLNVKMRREV